jgi:multidrug efflux pump subunit AcrA (membrane-fusion protein)
MHPLAAARKSSAHSSLARHAASRLAVLGFLAAGIASAAGLAWLARSLVAGTSPDDLITQQATVGTFTHDVVERGELESSANVSVRCEVQSRTTGSNGVKILEIVPEGTIVKQGDFLVRFDDAALQSERTTQQINVSSAEATLAQSQNDLAAAIIAKKEYEFGEFETEREKIRAEILVAEENASRAKESVAFTERLVRRGYIAPRQLRIDKFDLARAQSDLKIANTKLNALSEFTREKKLTELDAKVKTCDAKLKSDEAKLALEKQKLEVLVTQISRCVVNAPCPGQVIYDHEQDNWRGAEFQIKQGTVIHEHRVVIRLPDPKQMQVVAKVAESRIDLIKQGMPATIEIEGLPGAALVGKVTKVNEYPVSENWFNANVKEYATTIQVVDPPDGLRPGMTAKVAVRVETIPDALQVPIQSVVERNGKHYCLLARGSSGLEAREVLIGSTNDKFLVIRDGLSPADSVLMNPRVHLSEVRLDDTSLPSTDAQVAAQSASQASKKAPRPVPAAVPGPGL